MSDQNPAGSQQYHITVQDSRYFAIGDGARVEHPPAGEPTPPLAVSFSLLSSTSRSQRPNRVQALVADMPDKGAATLVVFLAVPENGIQWVVQTTLVKRMGLVTTMLPQAVILRRKRGSGTGTSTGGAGETEVNHANIPGTKRKTPCSAHHFTVVLGYAVRLEPVIPQPVPA